MSTKGEAKIITIFRKKSDIHAFTAFPFHIIFVRKLLGNMVYQKDRVNRKHKTWDPGRGHQHR